MSCRDVGKTQWTLIALAPCVAPASDWWEAHNVVPLGGAMAG
jgi:hypothetical protein